MTNWVWLIPLFPFLGFLINGLFGWTVTAQELPDGEALKVTTTNQDDVQKIRALGFLGILTLGTHQLHHLEMARGEMMHMR